MPPIELGPTRPVGAVDVRIARSAGTKQDAPTRAEAGKATVVKSDALEPGAAPVDGERVAEIRKAVESGTYPLLPTRVADAIIAAGYLLRSVS